MAPPEAAADGGEGPGTDLFSSSLVSFYVDDPRFVPRPWLVKRVEEAWGRDDARFVLLTGEPGSGKSALLAHLARRHPKAPRHFIRRDSVTPLQGGDAPAFLFSVGHQLASLHPSLFDPKRLEVVVNLRAGRIAPGGRAVGIKVEDLRASPFYQTSLRVIAHGEMVEGELMGLSAGIMIPEPRMEDLSNLQYLALLDPALALAEQDPAARIVVLVDALDEVRWGPSGEDLLFWLSTCPELPPNVRVVLTSRPDPAKLDSFRRAKTAEITELVIDPDAAEDRGHIDEDLGRFLDQFAAEPGVAGALHTYRVERSSFVEEATERAQGNFQYAVALTRGIDAALATEPPSEDLPALLRLEGVPPETTELYRFFLGRIKERADQTPVKVSSGPLAEPEDRPAWEALYRPVLAALAVAFEPLSAEQIGAYAAAPPEGLPRALEELNQFLDRLPDGAYRLYHATFPEFLTGEATASADDPFHVDPAAWHGLLAGRLLRANPDWLGSQDRYPLAHTPAHLIEAIRLGDDPKGREELVVALTALLTDLGFLEQKTHARGVGETIRDLKDGLAVLPPEEADVREIYRIIGLEAHHLNAWDRKRIPAFFAQQIHNRAVRARFASWGKRTLTRLRAVGGTYLELRWRAGLNEASLVGTLGHEGGVNAVSLTPDGRLALSGSGDGTIKLWDLGAEREEPRTLFHGEPIDTVALTPDGRLALSGSRHGTIRVWNLETDGEEPRTLFHGGAIHSVALTADGGLALSGSGGGTIKVWDLGAGRQEPRILAHGGFVGAVALTPDGRRALSASGDGTIKVWDPRTEEERPRTLTHGSWLWAAALTPDGRLALSGSDDGTIKVWDLADEDMPRTLFHGEPVEAVAVTADGRLAISSSRYGTVKVWDLGAERETPRTLSLGRRVSAIALTHDGRLAVSGSAEGKIRVWDLEAEQGEEMPSLGGWVSAVALTTDGRLAVSGSRDGTIKVWDLGSEGMVSRTLTHGGPVSAVALAADGHLALSGSGNITSGGLQGLPGSGDGTVNVWDLQAQEEEAETLFRGTMVNAVAVTPDGRLALSGSRDGTIRVWDLAAGGKDPRILDHRGWVNAVAITSSGGLALSGADDGTIRVWNLAAGGKNPRTLNHGIQVRALAVTPDGRLALSGSRDGTIRVWDLAAGREAESRILRHGGPVCAVAVTPDGRRALSASEDGLIKVWELGTDRFLTMAHVADSELTSVATAANLEDLVAGDASGNVYCLRLSTALRDE
jgi:WD40 repeat protein